MIAVLSLKKMLYCRHIPCFWKPYIHPTFLAKSPGCKDANTNNCTVAFKCLQHHSDSNFNVFTTSLCTKFICVQGPQVDSFLTFVTYKNKQLLASLNMVLLLKKKSNPLQMSNCYVKHILRLKASLDQIIFILM